MYIYSNLCNLFVSFNHTFLRIISLVTLFIQITWCTSLAKIMRPWFQSSCPPSLLVQVCGIFAAYTVHLLRHVHVYSIRANYSMCPTVNFITGDSCQMFTWLATLGRHLHVVNVGSHLLCNWCCTTVCVQKLSLWLWRIVQYRLFFSNCMQLHVSLTSQSRAARPWKMD